MADDLLTDDLETQLHHYGRWLEQRSDVVLSPRGELNGQAPVSSRRSVTKRAVVLVSTAAVLVAALAVGLTLLDNRSELTTAADERSRPASGTADGAETDREESPPPVLEVDGSDPSPAAPSGDPTPVPTEGDSGESSSSEPVADSPPANDPQAVNPSSDRTNRTLEDSTDSTPNPDTGRPAAASGPDPEPAGDSDPDLVPPAPVPMFTSPSVGAMIDRNIGATFKVNPVAGAVTYTFVGSQEHGEVFRISASSPAFVLPSRLSSDGQMSVEPGALTVSVEASDGSGALLSRGTITVMVRPENLPPRYGPTTP